MTTALALLESSFKIPQHLQLLSIRNYAISNNINISFYGNERVGYENRHDLFIEYIEKSREEAYLFFTIEQFIFNDIFYTELLIEATNKGLLLFFANENLKITNRMDIINTKILLLSKTSRAYRKISKINY